MARHILYVNGRLYVNGGKCDGCIFGRDGWRIVDAGMIAGTCHKLDDEKSLWTVDVIGVSEPREDPPKKIMGPRQAGRKCDGRIFGRDDWRIVDAGMVAGTCHKLYDERSLWTVVVIGVSEPRE